MMLTEMEILCNCPHRILDTNHDVAAMIAQFTKSVAQIPYKLLKQQQQQETEWYTQGDNKDCVRVDNKNGHGTARLWQQQLTQFPLARLETADAIISQYPSPLSLMFAYESLCQKEGERLLQEIPVRRAAGPLAGVRKIGPELSRKVHLVFTSANGDDYL